VNTEIVRNETKRKIHVKHKNEKKDEMEKKSAFKPQQFFCRF
jgi:hypothetical protein